ncbi:MAG: polysaccharide pyruvyl transferase family protein [Proteobacteria bacterium]|nr:polysaccharide pyruvyl transferase family protein [Pseudomonadota bacterium]
MLRACWCRTPSRANFGDALTPWLMHRLTGRMPRYVPPRDTAPHWIVSGSIAGFAHRSSSVWGAGLMWRDEPLCPQARWLAVRGPITRDRVVACGGACPPVCGDPALLLPRLLAPAAGARNGVGLAPHFSDRYRLSPEWLAATGVRLIDMQDGIESVVAALTSCAWIMASSLHGLIVAHAYGIPATRVHLHDLPGGDGVKFDDHYAALDRAPSAPVALDACEWPDWRTLERAAWAPATLSTDALWRSCPFRDDDACD